MKGTVPFWILPLALSGGAFVEAWATARWTGLSWWLITWTSGIALGGYATNRRARE